MRSANTRNDILSKNPSGFHDFHLLLRSLNALVLFFDFMDNSAEALVVMMATASLVLVAVTTRVTGTAHDLAKLDVNCTANCNVGVSLVEMGETASVYVQRDGR